MPLPLNLVYLKYFCDAAKSGSISQSAKQNFVTQSAISQGIHKLEEALGKELITHQQNKFKITPEGETVLEKSRDIFQGVLELEGALTSKKGEVSGRIEFACMHSFALALLPEQLKKLRALYPKLQVNFRLGHTDMIRELIRKRIIDFGIVLDNEDLSGFQCHEIYRGEYRLYIAKKEQHAEKLAFITSEELMETNLLRKAYLKKYRRELDVLMQVSSWEVIAKLTEQGLGIGFFPDYVALQKRELRVYDELKLPSIQYKVYAIFPQSVKLHKNHELFLQIFSKKIK